VNLKRLQIKHRIVATIATITFFALLAIPVQSAAQEFSAAPKKQPRYRLIDLGTLGGPNSAEFEFPFINNKGVIVGAADTALPDPNAPDCYDPDCFIIHGFIWQHGVMNDLGALPGAYNSEAIWNNNNGLTVGQSQNGLIDPLLGFPAGVAVLWKRSGQVINLGTFGGYESLAAAINDRGQIVGGSTNDVPDVFPFWPLGFMGAQTRAFFWEKGVMLDIGTLGGPDAFALFVNQFGQVAGASYTSFNPNPVLNFCGQFSDQVPTMDPFLWTNGNMIDLGTLGGTCGVADALNNHGQVVGFSDLKEDIDLHPFLWPGQHGMMRDLGTLGGNFGEAKWLNDRGEVVGWSTTPDVDQHAFFWKDGVMTDLGTVEGDTCSVAKVINEKGQVVGNSGSGACDEVHGFLWQQGRPMIDLNTFVPPGSDLQITDAEFINDQGEITATGMLPNGNFHAVVLIPCGAAQRDDGCRDADEASTSLRTDPTSPQKRFSTRHQLRFQDLMKVLGRRVTAVGVEGR